MDIEGKATEVKITTVYDNSTLDPNLAAAWGFACMVEFGGHTILFDTGGDAPRLLGNMDRLGLDPRRIEAVVLSHIHGDHTGGLGGLLAIHNDVTVYIPRAFPARFKARVRAMGATLVEVSGPMEIVPGVYTTGEMGNGIVEQALVAKSPQGLVVITGCAHPGIVRMVERAREVGGGGRAQRIPGEHEGCPFAFSSPLRDSAELLRHPGDSIHLVLGGFHLGGKSKAAIRRIIADFRRLGVQKVALCHCSGDRARAMFAAEYGDDYILNGVGGEILLHHLGSATRSASNAPAAQAPHQGAQRQSTDGCGDKTDRQHSMMPSDCHEMSDPLWHRGVTKVNS